MDSDDLGPRAELDYWKKRMSCCNYLLDQLKSPEVSTVFGVLLMSKSKLIKVRLSNKVVNKVVKTVFLLSLRSYVSLQTWQELDTRITDVFNEAKDNVKYLYSLEKYYDPLYNSDPVRKVFYTTGPILFDSISLYCENDVALIIFSSYINFEHTNMQIAVFFSPQVSMLDAIPGLINAIRMIHTISRYYSIPENIRSLFVKVAISLAGACF